MQSRYRTSDRPPWIALDCKTCSPDDREHYGCTAPSPPNGMHWRSMTDPDAPRSRRCPRAFLNPDTDLFDPGLAEVLSIAMEREDGIAYVDGGSSRQPVNLSDACNLVCGVWSQLQRMKWESDHPKDGP